MNLKLDGYSHGGGHRLSIRCPSCGHIGTFESLTNIPDLNANGLHFCQRRCPNPQCHGHVFCIHDQTGTILRMYPPQRIGFEQKGIPPRIAKTFSEALSCQAESLHVASAIMIRRTLEELCEDKQAVGNDLKARIGQLRNNVVLPPELFAALDDLRLLGNDAAHIEAKTYDSVGSPEILVAIELTKEILKSVYQLDDLVARLRALKKP